ncbi:alpha-lactalbumin-like [Mastacembelus armatus]|nr:alpha-lactalbumin-like [Mastacembelus armatus]
MEDGDSSREGRGKRKQKKPWSLGLYGLFQLSDGYFCDSGYRWSRNKCGTACSAFTDDNILDDIACLVKTDYWKFILKEASLVCLRTRNFFSECK